MNPLFLLLSLGAAAETLIISGVSSFAFKYLAEQYSMSFDKAGNLLGEPLLSIAGTQDVLNYSPKTSLIIAPRCRLLLPQDVTDF